MKYLLSIGLIAFLFLSAFQDSDDKRTIAIQSEIDDRLEAYKIEKERDCRERAVARAEEIIDSIIFRGNTLPTIDTFQVPNRPERPSTVKPIEIDTAKEIKPLFDEKQ